MPALIIHGSGDKIVPIEATSRRAAEIIPSSQYIVYEGAPHGLFYTHRERLNRDIIEFMQTGKVKVQQEEIMIIPSTEGLILPGI